MVWEAPSPFAPALWPGVGVASGAWEASGACLGTREGAREGEGLADSVTTGIS